MRALQAVLLAAASLLCWPAQAYHLPKWEVGVGISALRIPAYRGARTVNNYLIPFPHVVYRGDTFKVDDDGIRGQLFHSRRLRLDISLAGNLPVSGDDVRARVDMPALDPVGEIGPSLDILLSPERVLDLQEHAELWLRLPLRLAFSVGDPPLTDRGWVFSPTLNAVYQKPVTARALLRLSLSLGPLFASERYHDYFYEVAPPYVTATREAFDAEAGYSGSRVSLGVSLRKRQWYLGAFLRYDDLRQAQFIDSPLVETDDYFTLALVLSRVLRTSAEAVAHE